MDRSGESFAGAWPFLNSFSQTEPMTASPGQRETISKPSRRIQPTTRIFRRHDKKVKRRVLRCPGVSAGGRDYGDRGIRAAERHRGARNATEFGEPARISTAHVSAPVVRLAKAKDLARFPVRQRGLELTHLAGHRRARAELPQRLE